MKEELISIIVPVYNAANYLGECIESILTQIYTHFELLLIDDGSTDASLDVCYQYKQKDSRISVYHHSNCGVAATRNRGIQLANGKYITFIDADDIVYPEYLRKLYIPLTDNRASIITMCKFVRLHENGKVEGKCEDFSQIDCSPSEFLRSICYNLIASTNLLGSSCRILIPRNLITEKNIYFPNIKQSEDQIFLIRLLSRCNYIHLVQDELYVYRIHSQSAVHSKYVNDLYDKLIAYLSQLEMALRVLDESEYASFLYDVAMLNAKQWLVCNCLNASRPYYELNILRNSLIWRHNESKRSKRAWQKHRNIKGIVLYKLAYCRLDYVLVPLYKLNSIIKSLSTNKK